MSIRAKTTGHGFASRYPESSRGKTATAGVCVLALLLSGGCAGVATMKSDPVLDYIEYMNRAVHAGPEVRQRMKREAEQQMESDPTSGSLKMGFLLTSPDENKSSVQAGEEMLRRVLAERAGLTPQVKGLVELRLAEVEARQSLQSDLRDVESKIERLLSIDSAMERKKGQEQTRPR